MVEYIKRDAALRALCQVSAPTPDESHIVEKCIEKINRLPMMEVVRCKDCVKRETVLCPLETYDDFPWRASREDDFCSYGERREGE